MVMLARPRMVVMMIMMVIMRERMMKRMRMRIVMMMMQAMTVSTVWGRRFAFSAPFIIRMCCLMLRFHHSLPSSNP